MKIIYVFNKNSYAAIKAAYLHLKLDFPEDFKDIVNCYSEEGSFYYLGIDIELNEIYLLRSSKCNYILKNLLKGFSNLYNKEILIIYPEIL
ncbi:MAG TPA: DUF3189 family protein [Clostridia bacterium]|nr:DUF3189 family protein [Clostridia bacterium]